MTNREFENYLTLVSRLLRLKRGQTEQIAGELRDHLELRVAELTESGVDVDEATRMALEEFGDAASLAGQFQFISETYKRRWMMRFATLSVAGLFLTAVLVMAMWPSGTRFGAPDTSVASESSPNPLGLTASSAASTTTIDDVEMSDATRRTIQARHMLQKEHVFDYNEAEFQGVLAGLNNEFDGLTFLLDRTAKDDSLPSDEPISFRTGPLPFNKAFRLLLKEHNATYVIQDGIVRVISLDVAGDPEFFTRRIFDVDGLLTKIHELEATRIMLQAVGGGDRGQSHGERTPLRTASVGCPSGRTPPESRSSGLTAGNSVADHAVRGVASGGGGGGSGGRGHVTAESILVDAIKHTVAADSWDTTNGDGTCEILGGLMIVGWTEEANEKIEELLQDLNYRFAQREQAADKN